MVIPATNRPQLARDALISTIRQSVRPYEVIFSNNGAGRKVFEAVKDLLECEGVSYYEHPAMLSMPEHWNFLVEKVRGTHLVVLTDRSVLKKDAIRELVEILTAGNGIDVISWPWDLYYESGFVRRYKAKSFGGLMSTSEILMDSLNPFSGYPVHLPRALNSCVSMSVIEKIRGAGSAIFKPINPDYSFAYDCLMSLDRLFVLQKPLMVVQGLGVSNGGQSYLGSAKVYVDSLGISEPFKLSPVKAYLVENTIVEDFLASCRRHQRMDLLETFDVASLYLRCYIEWSEKKAAGLLSGSELWNIRAEIDAALERENLMTRKKVQKMKARAWRRYALQNIKRLIPYKHRDKLRTWMFSMGMAEPTPSALHAAGFL